MANLSDLVCNFFTIEPCCNVELSSSLEIGVEMIESSISFEMHLICIYGDLRHKQIFKFHIDLVSSEWKSSAVDIYMDSRSIID